MGELDVDAAVDLVFDWLRAYREYEIEMFREDERAERDDRFDEFEDEWEKAAARLQAPFWSPRVIEMRIVPSYSSPPKANPDGTILLSVIMRGGTFTIITSEPAQHCLVPPYVVRYRVRDTELGLRIDERQILTPSGGWTESGA